MIKEILGWVLFASIMAGTVYAGIYTLAVEQRRIQETACFLVGGNGDPIYKHGIPVDYHCQRMHLVLKYKNGVYK